VQQGDHLERVPERGWPEAALGAAVAAGVVRERGHAVGAAAAREIEVALLRRARSVEDHHAHVGLLVRQEQRIRKPVVYAELGR
jgi:hypothetical protein